MKQIKAPEEAGRIVAMVTFQGNLLVATEYQVYQLVGDELVPLEFKNEENTETS